MGKATLFAAAMVATSFISPGAARMEAAAGVEAVAGEVAGLSRGAGTIWDAVQATESGRFWVHGNATEHMYEYAVGMLNRGISQEMVNLGTQQQIRSIQAAVGAASKPNIPFGTLVRVGEWELKLAAPRTADHFPAIIHALPR